MNVVGIVAFAVAILLSVMLHEAGHFLTAKRFGMKATQFFVGFGPTLFSRTKGETEYGVKAIPAGGFVKIVGMTPLEEMEPGDEGRAFFKQPPGRKIVVLCAGSFVHFMICIGLIFATILAFGLPDNTAPVLGRPADCLATTLTATSAIPKSQLPHGGTCPAGTVPGIAAAAGFRSGDRVLSAGGTPIKTYLDFTKVIRGSAGKPLDVVVERHGKTLALPVTPRRSIRPDLVHPKTSVEVGAIGVVQGDALKRVGVIGAVQRTGDILDLMVTGTWNTLTHKLGTITRLYDKNRDAQGFVGVVGAGRVSGEVFNAPLPFSFRLIDFFLLVASLNLFIGVFNLLPLLPLDGGHVAVVVFESVRDKLRRANGYVGEIKRVDYNKLLPVTMAVIAVFAVLTVWILGADIVNPIRLSQ